MGCYGNAARRAGARASGNGCCHAPAVSLNANQLAKGDVCERGLASAPAGVAGMAAFSGCGYELQTICVALYILIARGVAVYSASAREACEH